MPPLDMQADTVTVAQITYQSFFKLYPKLSGMTGTAKTEASAVGFKVVF